MFRDPSAVRQALLHEFANKNFLVVGDAMLDRYISGRCEKISQEAPVLVLRPDRRRSSIGGASNVANNFAKLGCKVTLAGVVGTDESGEELQNRHLANDIDAQCLLTLPRFRTVVKTRILAGEHQLLRIDEEENSPLSEAEAEALLNLIDDRLDKVEFQAVVLSDYAKGTCTAYLCANLARRCRDRGIPVYADPKGKDYRKYAGTIAIKPNLAEITLLAHTEGWPSNDPLVWAKNLQEMLDLEFVALTLGPKGIALIHPGGTQMIPAVTNEVFDVSGAGDTVIATMVAGLSCHLDLLDAVALGNVAAGLVTSKVGCVPVERAELMIALQKYGKELGAGKFYSLPEVTALAESWRQKQYRIGFVSGKFADLDAQLVRTLRVAATGCDKLVVGVFLPDEKGDVIEILSALEFVDAIVAIHDNAQATYREAIRPDIFG